MMEAEEQLHCERLRSRQLESNHAALLEQVEFLKQQEHQRHATLLSSLSPVASPSAPVADLAAQDNTLSLLAEHIIDARDQVVALQVMYNHVVGSCCLV
jgi:hypothetical protein